MAETIATKATKDQSLNRAHRRASNQPLHSIESEPTAEMLALQESAGNRAVNAALRVGNSTPAAAVKGLPPIVKSVLQSSGQPLDPATRSYMESRFGQDFSGVRVHTDGKAAESAQAVNANAYTVRQDIVFNQGRYAPETIAGKQLLGHELTHTAQQMRNAGLSSSPRRAEHEADQAAVRVVAGEAATVQLAAIGMQCQVNSEELRRKIEVAKIQLTQESNPELERQIAEWEGQLQQTVHVPQALPAAKPKPVPLRQKVAAAKEKLAQESNPELEQQVVESEKQLQQTVFVPQALPAAEPKPVPSDLYPIIPPVGTSAPPLDFKDVLNAPQRNPNEVIWLGNPMFRPSWTEGMESWKDVQGNTNFSSPEFGTATLDIFGKQRSTNSPHPDRAKVERVLKAEAELAATGNKRFIEGKGWLDETGWQRHIQERGKILSAEANGELENLESGARYWSETQGGLAYAASVPSHLLGGRWFDDASKIISSSKQDIQIALREIEKARTPSELAEAEQHLKFATSHGRQAFSQYKEDVFSGGERTKTGIKVAAAAATAYYTLPVMATYGVGAVTAKGVLGGALAGGVFSGVRQGVQRLEGSRKDFSVAEVGQGAVLGGGLALVPEFAPLMMGMGVASAGDEFSQDHYLTGTFDIASSLVPIARHKPPPGSKLGPSFGQWLRPRAAALGMRVQMGLENTGLGGSPSVGIPEEPVAVLVADASGQTSSISLESIVSNEASVAYGTSQSAPKTTSASSPTFGARLGSTIPLGIPVSDAGAEPFIIEPTSHKAVEQVTTRRPRGFDTGRASPGRRVRLGTMEELEPTAQPSVNSPRRKAPTRQEQLEGIDPNPTSKHQSPEYRAAQDELKRRSIDDPNVDSYIRNWLKQERKQRGNNPRDWRNPPGYDTGHIDPNDNTRLRWETASQNRSRGAMFKR